MISAQVKQEKAKFHLLWLLDMLGLESIDRSVMMELYDRYVMATQDDGDEGDMRGKYQVTPDTALALSSLIALLCKLNVRISPGVQEQNTRIRQILAIREEFKRSIKSEE